MAARIDAHIAVLFRCSRSKAQQLIRTNNVFVNEVLTNRCAYKVARRAILATS